MNRTKIIISTVIIIAFLASNIVVGQSTAKRVTIKLNIQNAGIEISPLASGLSYETKDILPNLKGEYYFHSGNSALIKMFKTLGIKHLRIGGNSVDASNVPLPSEKDIHTFFQFARAADLKIVYSMRLQNGVPDNARKVAKIINDNYKDLVESISIGNEPEYYPDINVYLEKWATIHDAIIEGYPSAVFNGPDTNPNLKSMKALITGFDNPKGRLMQISQHNYPFGCSYQNYEERVYLKLIPRNEAESRDRMLQPDAYKEYEKVLNQIRNAIEGTTLNFRLSETNSYWYSGLKGVSNSNASALWALDYLYWWTTHGAAGLNFHTGDVTGGTQMQPAFYAAFVTSPKGYAVMPLAYGMKLFQMGSNGKVIPVEVTTPENQNLVAYAIQSKDGITYLTIINKEYKENKGQSVSILFDKKIKGLKIKALVLRLNENNIAGIASLTLGGGAIEDNGNWEGKWEDLRTTNGDDSTIGITMPGASALLIEIKK